MGVCLKVNLFLQDQEHCLAILWLIFMNGWMNENVQLLDCEIFLSWLQSYLYLHPQYLGQCHSHSRYSINNELTKFFWSFRISVIDYIEDGSNLIWIRFSGLLHKDFYENIN